MATVKQALTAYLTETPAVLQGDAFSGAELAADRAFVTPAELWLRSPRILSAMRARGVSEELLTGACADYEKMTALLSALGYTAGDTLPADIATDLAYILGKAEKGEATTLWQKTTATFAARNITPRTLLSAHRAALLSVAVDTPEVLAAFSHTVRPLFDASALLLTSDFAALLKRLSAAYQMHVGTMADLERLLASALRRFAAAGAPAVLFDLSGFDRFLRPDPYHAGLAFDRLKNGEALTPDEQALFIAQLLRVLGAAACELNLRLVLRVRPKTEHVMGDFSALALKKLLSYLTERRVMPPTLLTLAAGELPQGLSPLLNAFCRENAPRLFFGIDGAGASTAMLRRSLRFYLSRGAANLLVGITDCDRGFFTNPSFARFARVLAAELADFVKNDMPEGFPLDAVFRTASAIYTDNAADFYNLK